MLMKYYTNTKCRSFVWDIIKNHMSSVHRKGNTHSIYSMWFVMHISMNVFTLPKQNCTSNFLYSDAVINAYSWHKKKYDRCQQQLYLYSSKKDQRNLTLFNVITILAVDCIL